MSTAKLHRKTYNLGWRGRCDGDTKEANEDVEGDDVHVWHDARRRDGWSREVDLRRENCKLQVRCSWYFMSSNGGRIATTFDCCETSTMQFLAHVDVGFSAIQMTPWGHSGTVDSIHNNYSTFMLCRNDSSEREPEMLWETTWYLHSFNRNIYAVIKERYSFCFWGSSLWVALARSCYGLLCTFYVVVIFMWSSRNGTPSGFWVGHLSSQLCGD